MKKETISYKQSVDELTEITRLVQLFNEHNNKLTITLNLTKKEQDEFLSLDKIIELVCKKSKLTATEINTASGGDGMIARQICHYISMKRSGKSLEEVGFYFGGKNAASVYYSRSVVRNMLETNKIFKSKWGDFINLYA